MPATETTNKVRDINFFAQNAEIGQFISVEIANSNRESFKTHLIGCKTGSFLVLEVPSVLDAGNVKDLIVLDRQLIIRTICERTTGDCMGFYSKVQGVLKVPYPVFFASYPEVVETRELRTEKRQVTAIPCVMFKHENGEQMPGIISDISNGGCRFDLVVQEEIVKIKVSSINLRYRDPVTNTEVTRLCEVCSQRKTGNVMSIGFAFVQPMQQTG